MKIIKLSLLIGILCLLTLILKSHFPTVFNKNSYLLECQKSTLNIIKCNRENHLTLQEKYDLFYNNYSKFFDDEFILTYTFAYVTCLDNVNKCKTHEDSKDFSKSRLEQNKQLCIKKFYPTCVSKEIGGSALNNNLDSKLTKKEKIQLFDNTIQKNYQKNSTVCIKFLDFYYNLSEKEKAMLSKITNIECQKLKDVGLG